MESSTPRITCEHFLKLRRGELPHVVVDIRDEADFEAGHIKGSLHIPHQELPTNIETLIPEKAKKMVVIVGVSHESSIERIHKQLADLGYHNVEFLAGGFDEFCEVAPIEVEPELFTETPEEEGHTGSGDRDDDADPNIGGAEPLL